MATRRRAVIGSSASPPTTEVEAAGLTEVMKDPVVWALKPGGGLSSLWNLALLRLTQFLSKFTRYLGLWMKQSASHS